MLSSHADPTFLNHANLWGETAAHLAAGAGHHAVLEALAELGAEMELRDAWGRTAAEVFSENYAGIVAAAAAPDRFTGPTSLPATCVLSKRLEAPLDEGLLSRLLADPKTDLAGKDMFGWSALHKLASWGHQRGLSAVLKEVERRSAVTVFEALSQKGGPEGKTVLHCAAESGWPAGRLIKSIFSYLTIEEAEALKAAVDKKGEKAVLPESL